MPISWLDFLKNTTACYILGILVLTVIYYYFTNRGIPPGPIGLPYFGYWPFLKDDICHLQLQEMGQKYGDVFSFTITGHLYISVGSIKSNKEAFVSKLDCFRERINSFTMFNCIIRGSMITTGGEEWKTNRKFFLELFHQKGISKMKGEKCGPIYDAIQDTIEDLRKSHGSPMNIKELLKIKCTKVFIQIFFGDSDITEEEILDINNALANIIENLNGPSVLLCGTFAKYFISPFVKSFSKKKNYLKFIYSTMQRIIERNKKTFHDSNTLNFFNAYYKEKLERLSKNDPTAEHFTDFILAGSLLQFIEEGIDTCAGFIECILSALAEYPEEQERIYQELEDVVGTERDPTIEDKSKLTYTNAFLSEVMRTGRIFFMMPKLQCTKEVTIGGYRIPKGSNMLFNMRNCHYDPDVYEDPEKFNPSRFLPLNGKKRPEKPILFGIGKHKCLGEAFVMTEVFLFMITILKYFRLQVPEDSNKKLIVCAFPRKDI